MSPKKKKLSASALNLFLKSPKAYYWAYVAAVAPIQQSVATYDHDKIFGQLWAEFVDRFYKEWPEEANCKDTLARWNELTEGWVPPKAHERYVKSFETLMPQYYQMFSPTDGARTPTKSELWLENDRFVARLDGLSDENIVHECKTTSRSPNLSDQLWKVQNSLQVRLYCVLAEADGSCIEFAFKDAPSQIYRGPVIHVGESDRAGWEQELNALADHVYSLGDDPNNYPCHPDGCCLVTKNMTSMCQYQVLCEQGMNDVTSMFFQPKKRS